MRRDKLDRRSKELRKLVIDGLSASGRGHLGSSLSLIEVLRVLYDDVLNYRAGEPGWPERDRFILSKGNGCLALYAILSDKGFFKKQELLTFCKINSRLGGHPEEIIPGVEVSTGSLGHGLSIACGMALAAKIEGKSFRTFTVIGDGESDEGSIWEAAMSIAKHKLSNLTVIVDYNKMQSYGTTREVVDLEPLALKWNAFGFCVREVDGHDIGALRKVFLSLPFSRNKPNAVICHTVKGKGIKFAEGNIAWHHRRGLTEEDIKGLYRAAEEY